MTDDQIERIREMIMGTAEHVLGPYKEPDSFAAGVHRIADALEGIVGALMDEGPLDRISGHMDRIAESLEKKNE